MDHSRYLAYRSTARALERAPEWQLDAHADRLWRAISDCGPLDPGGSFARSSALAFAGHL